MEKKFAYGRYCQTRDASMQFLLDMGISALPVPMFSPTRRLDILLGKYSANIDLIRNSGLEDLLDADGFTYQDPNRHLVIFYNDRQSRQESRFTIAHELGHILLGHMGPNPRCYVLSPGDRGREQAADQFALRILAPACVLWAKGLYTAQEIAAACDIPLKAARTRARRMKKLLPRNMWLTKTAEQEVFAQFGLSDPRTKAE